jgi:3-deoxy-7-phosphoheptulonate synthase
MGAMVVTSQAGAATSVRDALAAASVSLVSIAPGVWLGPDDDRVADLVAGLAGVKAVHRQAPPWPLASTLLAPSCLVPVGDVVCGGRELVVIAGPCAVESEAQLERVGDDVVAAGAHAVRGGAFKPRTSPYSFQGLGHEGLRILQAWKARRPRVAIVTEVLDTRDVAAVADVADVLQIGARNMQNSALLCAVAETKKPVLLKRGFGNTAAELLHSAEYLLARGNDAVILCERGIRTLEPGTRFTLDVGAVAWLKQRSRLPVIVDPSHAAGISDLVTPLALAGIAVGADGIMIEVHDDPATARSDGDQALILEEFKALLDKLAPVAAAVGRTLSPLSSSSSSSPSSSSSSSGTVAA